MFKFCTMSQLFWNWGCRSNFLSRARGWMQMGNHIQNILHRNKVDLRQQNRAGNICREFRVKPSVKTRSRVFPRLCVGPEVK